MPLTSEILTFPSTWYGAVTGRFYLASGSQKSASPWSGRRSVYGPHRQVWRAEVQLPPKMPEMWRPLSAFFSEVAGERGLIRIGDMHRVRPIYNILEELGTDPFSDATFFDDGTGWLDAPLPPTIHVVTAADRGVRAAHVGGLPASIARTLRRGDLFEIRRNGIADETPSLHEVTRDAPTDSSGESLVEFTPALRKGVAAGDMVVLEYPTSVFRCVDDDQGVFERDSAHHGSAGFSLVENMI